MGQVAVVARDTNRLDVFAIDVNSGVSHKGWDGVNWNPPGTDWESLGGEGVVWQLVVTSWEPSRLDVIAVAWGDAPPRMILLHKAWTGSSWSPSKTGWNNLGGDLADHEPMVAAWGPNRLDVFAVFWSDHSMYHNALAGSGWSGWSPLGGEFKSGAAGASWGPNRLDVFGVGKSLGMWHKAWMGTHWHPSNPSWQGLGGVFTDAFGSVNPPAVVSWGPDRLDIFGVGKSLGMWHKAWTGSGWYPSTTDWQALGGKFRNHQPAAVSWGPDRLDIFAIGDDYAIYHKAWMGTHWHPSNPSWQGLGGGFGTFPAAASWGPDRLDVFAVRADQMMYQKTWNGSQWEPPLTDWQPLGGQFVTTAF